MIWVTFSSALWELHFAKFHQRFSHCEQSSKRTQELLKNRLVWVRRIFFHFFYFSVFLQSFGFCRWRFFGLSWWGRSHIASSRQMGLLCILQNKDLLVCTLESPGHLLISQNHLELMSKDMFLSGYTSISRASFDFTKPPWADEQGSSPGTQGFGRFFDLTKWSKSC
jgi:hypothetical protein